LKYLNTDTLDTIKSRATGAGPSQSAQYLLDKQGLDQQSALDQIIKSGGAAGAAARGALARSGGLSAGARARLAAKQMRNDFTGRQQLTRQGQADRLGILANDENQKLDLLKMLPGAETQRAGAYGTFANTEAARQQQLDLSNRDYRSDVDKTNLASRIQNTKGLNDYNQKLYEERMKGYAANRSADATENSGKK
jgi:hypothetical protein